MHQVSKDLILNVVAFAPTSELETSEVSMPRFGSRVVDETSIAAIALLGHTGPEASISCTDAGSHAPLWLMPSSEAPPFTAGAFSILGVALIVAGALAHPAVADLSFHRLGKTSRRQPR